MTSNLKLLGLALAAVLALGAISASGASAATEPIAHVFCDGYPCFVTGEQPAAEKHKFVTAAGAIECEVAKFASSEITGPTTGLTITPTQEKCVLHNNLTGTTDPATVTNNGCDYKYTVHFHETKKGGGVVADQFSGDFHIICPEGKKIEFHVFKNEAHTELKCTYQVEATTVDNIDYKDETTSAIELTTTESPTSIKRTSGTLLNCGAENQTQKYTGSVTTKCENKAQATTSCGVKTTPEGGGEEEITGPIAHVFCDGYASGCFLRGEQPPTEKHKFVTAAGAVECEVAKFVSSELTGPTTGLTVRPKYEGCALHNNLTGTTDPATVTTNDCDYKFTIHFHETKKGTGVKADEFSGDADLTCPEGSKIEIHAYKNAAHTELKCTYVVEQTAVDNIDYKDETSSAIEVNATESSTSIKRTSGTLLNCGAENQTAKYTGKVTAKCENAFTETTSCGIKTTP